MFIGRIVQEALGTLGGKGFGSKLIRMALWEPRPSRSITIATDCA